MFLCSCGGSKKIFGTQTELNEIVVSSSANEYRPSEPRIWDIVHTDITINPFLKKNDSFLKEAAGEVVIKLHPYCYPADSLALDAKSMDIDVVALQKPLRQELKYVLEDDKLIIKFHRKFQATDTIQLYVQYRAKPYAEAAGGSSAISEDRGLYFINNNYEIAGKPKQIWTQGETQANSHWFPTLDQPNEKFTVSVTIQIPDSLTTLSNGKLVSSRKAAGDRYDRWEMNQPIQTYAVMFAIGTFSKIEDKSWNGKEVSYYVEPEYAPYAKQIFKNTPEMIAYFSELTGLPYPWNKYSQIVVRDYVSGAMENTSASLFGEFMNQNARENADKGNDDIVAHELFHQWFGDYVTAESWSNLTVNESFATYGSQLWRKHHEGSASADEAAFNDVTSYLRQAENDDPHLVRYYYNSREDMFDRVSYQKGSAILRYLHGLAGDSAFYKAMNLYLVRHAYGNAEASDWRKALEEATGTDWNWFFNQWYYNGGHPELRLTYQYDDAKQQLQVNVLQVQADSSFTYKLPLKAKLVYGTAGEKIDWNIQKRKQTFTYPYRNGVKPLFIPDTEHWVVGTIHEGKNTQEWLQQFLASTDDYISKRRSLAAAFYAQKDSSAQAIFREALKDKMHEVRSYALSLLEQIPDKYNWHKNFKEDAGMLALHDGNRSVRANAFDVLGSWKITALKDEMIRAVHDSSYIVAGAALQALASIDSAMGYAVAKEMVHTNPRIDLQDAVWAQLAKAGEPDDFILFEKDVYNVYGRRRISLAQNISLYNTRTRDEGAFEKGLNYIKYLAQTESIKSYRFSIGSLVFELYGHYSSTVGNKNNAKTAIATRRLAALQKAKADVLHTEQDPANKMKYKQLESGARK
ncbi:MAG TPA: M1 family metallopeptidase [Flavipsychrobacter sp.]|nr:M1 family metallopeptidase [Flavipsychrobacter sp.]